MDFFTLQIILVVIMLVLSVFFAAAEIGIISASPGKLQKLKKDGNPNAQRALKLMERKDELLGSVLIGYNFVTIAASTLTTNVSIILFGNSAHVLAAVTVILTVLIIIYGEIMPKTYAVKNAEKVSIVCAPIFTWLIIVLRPLLRVIQWIVDGTYRLFGVTGGQDMFTKINALDTIRGTIELHHEGGEVITEDKYMLGGVIDLNDVTVDEVMVHRNDVTFVSLSDAVPKIIDKIVNSRHSRVPVCSKTIDEVLGLVHVKDILKLIHTKRLRDINKDDIKNLCRTPLFIPDKKSLRQQLEDFRNLHKHLAFVVDEYGEIQGIVTLEDIIEEVVGQIDDEYDIDSDHRIRANKDGSFTVSADLTIRDLNRTLHWDIADRDAATIGGLIMHLAKGIPDLGESYRYQNHYRLKLVRKKGNKLSKIRIAQV